MAPALSALLLQANGCHLVNLNKKGDLGICKILSKSNRGSKSEPGSVGEARALGRLGAAGEAVRPWCVASGSASNARSRA